MRRFPGPVIAALLLPAGVLLAAPAYAAGGQGAAPTSTTLQMTVPHSFVDETHASMHLVWKSSTDKTPVPGRVSVYVRYAGSSKWIRNRGVRLGPTGQATFTVSPRADTYWKAVGTAGSWWAADTTGVHFLDNTPPGTPVKYPSAAPRPASSPAQPHAVGSGPHASITRIPNSVWHSMVGRTWHSGCPVGRASLRLVRINYWDFAGYRRRGEVVLRRGVAARAAAAFADMYRAHDPIRRMYRIDRWGYTKRTHGGNDYAAMQHDDTSGFNCRWVDGRPGVMSPHAYGTAVDINTFENPYHSAKGIVPDRWWAHHTAPRITWRSRSNPVVRIWLRHGFHWTYANQDSQHYDGRSKVTVSDGAFAAD